MVGGDTDMSRSLLEKLNHRTKDTANSTHFLAAGRLVLWRRKEVAEQLVCAVDQVDLHGLIMVHAVPDPQFRPRPVAQWLAQATVRALRFGRLGCIIIYTESR